MGRGTTPRRLLSSGIPTRTDPNPIATPVQMFRTAWGSPATAVDGSRVRLKLPMRRMTKTFRIGTTSFRHPELRASGANRNPTSAGRDRDDEDPFLVGETADGNGRAPAPQAHARVHQALPGWTQHADRQAGLSSLDRRGNHLQRPIPGQPDPPGLIQRRRPLRGVEELVPGVSKCPLEILRQTSQPRIHPARLVGRVDHLGSERYRLLGLRRAGRYAHADNHESDAEKREAAAPQEFLHWVASRPAHEDGVSNTQMTLSGLSGAWNSMTDV